MKSRNLVASALVLALVAVVALVPVAAREISKLPADKTLPTSDGSPGPVVFSHASHVDSSRPDCTSCHPRAFPILSAAAKSRPAIRHEAMEQGNFCGKCHNGRAGFAFGFDDCTACHRSES